MTAPETTAPAARGTALRPFLLALWLTTALVLSMSDRADPDLWGHVRYGADALAAGELPTVTTYAFTAQDYPWVNHEWASELVFATAAAAAGGAGLTALKLALGLALFALVIAVGRRQDVELPALAMVVLLAAINVSPGWTVRPQLFSFLAFAIVIALLDRAFQARSGRFPWGIPLVFVAWVNFHAGFVAGLLVLAVYLAGHVAEMVVRGDPRSRRDVMRAVAVLAAASAALLCTPYGAAFVPWLAHAVTLSRPAISEWQALGPSDPRFVPFLALLALIVVVWVGSRRPRPWSHTAVLLVVAFVSCRHARHVPFLAVLAGLWIPSHLQSLRARRRGADQAVATTPPPAAVRIAAWGTVAVLLLAVGLRVRAPWVDTGIYPVDAFAYMRVHRLTGRLVAHFDWAQYAIYAFAPATSLQFDGRFETAYPAEAAETHFDFLLGDRPERERSGSPARILEEGDPELVLVSRRYPEPVAIMQRAGDDWVLLYQDALAQLWGRRSKYGDADSRDFIALADRTITERVHADRVPWPARP